MKFALVEPRPVFRAQEPLKGTDERAPVAADDAPHEEARLAHIGEQDAQALEARGGVGPLRRGGEFAPPLREQLAPSAMPRLHGRAWQLGQDLCS